MHIFIRLLLQVCMTNATSQLAVAFPHYFPNSWNLAAILVYSHFLELLRVTSVYKVAVD